MFSRCSSFFLFLRCPRKFPKTGVGSPVLTVARFYVVVIIEISAFEFRFVRLFDDGAGMNRLLIGLFVAFRRLFVGNYLVLVVFHFYFFKHTISTAISAGFTPDMREA